MPPHPTLIDSHCHLDSPAFDLDRESLITACHAAHIEALIIPGVTDCGWGQALALCRKNPMLYTALGLHPLFIETHAADALEQLEERLEKHPEVVAVGEIGLDYYPTNINRNRQQQLFSAQLSIAYKQQKPLLLHVRKAHQDVLELLKRQPHHGGIVHAFSGSYEQARSYIDAGFLIGIGGVLTRSNAHKLQRVAQRIPPEAIALETDAPDLPPVWAKGERNSPLHLPAIAETLAKLRGCSVESLMEQTTKNVRTTLALNG